MSSILSRTFDQDLTLAQANCWVSVAIFSHAKKAKKNEYAWPVPWSHAEQEKGNPFANRITTQEFELQDIISKFYLSDAKEKIALLVSQLFECNVVRMDTSAHGYENFTFMTYQSNEPLIQICYGKK